MKKTKQFVISSSGRFAKANGCFASSISLVISPRSTLKNVCNSMVLDSALLWQSHVRSAFRYAYGSIQCVIT